MIVPLLALLQKNQEFSLEMDTKIAFRASHRRPKWDFLQE